MNAIDHPRFTCLRRAEQRRLNDIAEQRRLLHRDQLHALLPDCEWQKLGINPLTLSYTFNGQYATETGHIRINDYAVDVTVYVRPHHAAGKYLVRMAAPHPAEGEEVYCAEVSTLLSDLCPHKNPITITCLRTEWYEVATQERAWKAER